MNKFIGSGRIVKNAIVNGQEKKALKFIMLAKHGYDPKEKKDLMELVPCVMFNPSEKQQEFLTGQGKGMHVEFEGRVATSEFEREGQPEFSTEVVIDKRTFNIVMSRSTAE